MEFQASVESQSAVFRGRGRTTETVSIYTRHAEDCPQSSEPYWRRCNRVQGLPAVQSLAIVNQLPMSDVAANASFEVEGGQSDKDINVADT